MFYLFEGLFLAFFIFAKTHDLIAKREKSFNIKLKKGNVSLKKLSSVLTILITIFIFQFTLTVGGEYKVIFTIANTYLMYRLAYSSWFRNRIMGLISQYENFVEKF